MKWTRLTIMQNVDKLRDSDGMLATGGTCFALFAKQ
jgi:hypothetical protein